MHSFADTGLHVCMLLAWAGHAHCPGLLSVCSIELLLTAVKKDMWQFAGTSDRAG